MEVLFGQKWIIFFYLQDTVYRTSSMKQNIKLVFILVSLSYPGKLSWIPQEMLQLVSWLKKTSRHYCLWNCVLDPNLLSELEISKNWTV